MPQYQCRRGDGVVSDERDALQRIYFTINATGVGLGPFECWLLLRGVKTLGVRMDRQQATAMRLAEWLVDKGLKVCRPA